MKKLLMAVAGLALAVAAAHAEPRKTAIFDLELVDTSGGNAPDERAQELARLEALGSRLRERLRESGRYDLVDIEPVRARALGYNLQACGGCDVKLAREVGAEIVVTGFVQKVSNLILNINVYMRDVATGRMIKGVSADIRGNTDESWRRGLEWLLAHRILPETQP
ncbi:DUF3280 domain-containing protein [Faunimonas sp. B44]|uniref:DUF3280 domain-containing protein n=1 Tax=Faunimonas sp. B44 TaxID=3461493 RepID=UPI0040445E9C